MSISAIIFEMLCKLAAEAGFNPNDFSCRIDPHNLSYIEYDVRLDYKPTDFHRVFVIRPYYESGSLSDYMIKQQIEKQVMIFLEELKAPEEIK